MDEQILSELFMVMDDSSLDGLISICDLFLTGVPARLADIESALHDGRIDDAAKAAHSLKGTGGAFGARRLSDVAARMERACLDTDSASTPELLDELRLEFLVFRDILQAKLTEFSPPPS